MSAQTLQEVNHLNYGLAFPLFENSVLGLTYLSRNVPNIPLTRAGFALSPDYANLHYTSYQESVFLVTYANAADLWNHPLYWGTSLKFFNKTLTDYEQGAGSAINLDLGLYTEPWRDLGLGFKVQNILQGRENRNAQGGMVWGSGEAENIAQYFAVGLVNRTLQRNLTLGLDFKKNISQEFYPITTHFGAEWHPLDALFFRAGAGQYLLAQDTESGGYNSLNTYYSLGLGLNIFGFRLDYAYCPDSEVADLTTHYFSLSYVGAEPAEKLSPPAKKTPLAVTPDAKLLERLTMQYPTGNLTTLETSLTVKAVLLSGRDYLFNGEEYTLDAGQNIEILLELFIGLNDLTLGLPEHPELYKYKILRLPKYDDIAEEKRLNSIVAIAALGYMSGDYPHRFNPTRNVSLQEAAAVVVRLEKNAEPILRGALDEVDILINQGLFRGSPDGRTRPDEKLTKGQLALILSRLLALPVRKARPDSIDNQEHWAEPAIIALGGTGLYEKSEFTPRDAPVTKAELADALYRLPSINAQARALYAYEDTLKETDLTVRQKSGQPLPLNNDRLLFEEAVRSAR